MDKPETLLNPREFVEYLEEIADMLGGRVHVQKSCQSPTFEEFTGAGTGTAQRQSLVLGDPSSWRQKSVLEVSRILG